MKSDDFPYPECSDCDDLSQCKHPDVAQDMLGSPICPPECPKPISILRATYNKRKQNKYVSNIGRDL